MSTFNEYANSPEFKRKLGHAGEDASKFAFKWIGVAISGFFAFVREFIKQVTGKG